MTMMSCQKIVTSLLFFQFMANLEQPGSRILETRSAKVTFSLTVTFYLTKSYLYHSFDTIDLNKSTFLTKINDFCKKMLTLAKLERSWY